MTTLTKHAPARHGQADRDLVAGLHTLADQFLALSHDRGEQRARCRANFTGGIRAGEFNAYEVAAVALRNELAGGPGIPPACKECGGNGCTPANDTPATGPVRRQARKDPEATRSAFRGPGDMARHEPEAFDRHLSDLAQLDGEGPAAAGQR